MSVTDVCGSSLSFSRLITYSHYSLVGNGSPRGGPMVKKGDETNLFVCCVFTALGYNHAQLYYSVFFPFRIRWTRERRMNMLRLCMCILYFLLQTGVYSTVEWSIHDPILLFPSSSCLRILTLVFFRPYHLLVGIYSKQFFILPRLSRCTTHISHSNHWAPYCWYFNTYINDTFPHSHASFPFAFRTPTLLFSCYLSFSFSLLLFFVTCSTLLRSSIPIPLIYSTLFPSFAHTYI